MPTTVNLILELRPAPPPEAPPQLALGCLVLHSHAAAGRKLQMTSEDVVAKAGLLRCAEPEPWPQPSPQPWPQPSPQPSAQPSPSPKAGLLRPSP